MSIYPNRPKMFYEWAKATWGTIATYKHERALRLIEEAIELAQCAGVTEEQVTQITRRVYSRPQGDILQEIGQVQCTLEAFAENIGASANYEADKEFARIQVISRDHFRERHQHKVDLGIATAMID